MVFFARVSHVERHFADPLSRILRAAHDWHSLCSVMVEGGCEVNEWKKRIYEKQEGAIGYILLWLMGVPVTVLFAIFLLRGCT
jgi:hypothetical protein